MASKEDRDRRERRRRDSDTHRKHHERRRSQGHGATSGSEGPGGRSKKGLSIDALAQLNEMNMKGHVPEPSQARKPERRRRKDQPRRGEYAAVDAEYETPRRERARKYESLDSDRDYESPRRTRRYRQELSESEGEPESPRRPRRSRAYAEPDLDDDDEDYERLERERRRRKGKKKRIVSGAIVEEGRSTPAIRGGIGSKHSSYNSIENEKSAGYSRPRWAKKKRC